MTLLTIFTFIVFSLGMPLMAGFEAPATQKQQNKVVDYTIEIPANWEIVKQNLGVDLVALAPKRESKYLFRENMNVISAKFSFDITRDEFYKFNIESLDNLLTDFDLESVQDVKIDGVPAKKLTYTHTMGIINVKVNQYLVLRNQKAYVITFTAAREDFDKIAPQFNKIVESIKFKS